MWITYDENLRTLFGDYNYYFNRNFKMDNSNYKPVIFSQVMSIQKQVVNKVEYSKYHHF